MARIICMANSYKPQGRCIAGIGIDTGKWIRPISQRTKAIYDERFIDGIIGNEPNLLDLLEIPIGEQSPDGGYQPENRYLNNGTWRRIRHLSTSEILRYVENTRDLLHNQAKKVDPDIFNDMPREQWKSLQLIRVVNPDFGLNSWGKKRCIFTYYRIRYELKVTDPAIINKIECGGIISRECLFTISMTTPYKTPSYDKPYCWKIVAGVVEL